MSISPLTNACPGAESRRPAPGRSAPEGTSFQDRLARNCAGAQTKPSPAAPDSGQAAFRKEPLLSALFDLKTAMLDRMKLSKEKNEEPQAWEKLMKYLDAWIESLREGSADIEKTARAYAALQADLEGGDTGREALGASRRPS